MDLADYLRSSRTSQAALGARVGVSQGRVAQWIAGEMIPEARCPDIEAATGGAVRCEDLRPDVDWTRDSSGAVTGYLVRIDPSAAQPPQEVA